GDDGVFQAKPLWRRIDLCEENVLLLSSGLLIYVTMKNCPESVRRHAEALKKMGAPMHDEQNQRDHRELRIDKVGVRGLKFPIQVRDKAHSIQNTVATMGMFVDLPKEFKGTHMSRFIEVLNAHGSVIHVENISEILRAL